jgi:hypothetical protein
MDRTDRPENAPAECLRAPPEADQPSTGIDDCIVARGILSAACCFKCRAIANGVRSLMPSDAPLGCADHRESRIDLTSR